MVRLKIAYLNFLDKEKKSLIMKLIHSLLKFFSLIYKVLICLRNYLYDRGFLKVFRSRKKVISVGNIVWSGTGKTSLVFYLASKLNRDFKISCITKGYALDEFRLLKQKIPNTFDGKNRVKLIKQWEDHFDLFILDDGFQYRRLYRDLDIVLVKEEDLRITPYLIPAGIFREPLSALKRADIVVVTYSKDKNFVKEKLSFLGEKPIFFAYYEFIRLLDIKKKDSVCLDLLEDKKIGVLSAIGYPLGFLEKLEELGIKVKKSIFYPDHYYFTARIMKRIEEGFLREGIEDIIITYKDFYHIDFSNTKLNYYILEVELRVEEEVLFFRKIKDAIA